MRVFWVFGAIAGCTSPLSAVDTDDPADADADADADSDTDADADADADVEPERLQIQRVSPAYGTNAGGYEVTLTGGPFDASASVAFAGTESTAPAEIVSVTEGELVVLAPESLDVGVVDVRVTTDTHEGAKPDAFEYYADGTGKYGAVGGVEYYEVVGDYWADPPPRDSAQAYLFFVEPQTAGYVELYFHPNRAGDGGCTRNYGDTAGSETIWADMVTLDPANTELRLSMPDNPPLALAPGTEKPWFYSAAILPADFLTETAYNLMQTEASEVLPRFSLEAIAKTPEPLVVTMPEITGATAPLVRQSMQLEWVTPTSSDPSYVVAMLDRHNPISGAVVESVTCFLRDDGQYTVPSSAWSEWPEGAQITLYLGRVTETAATLPYNHAKSGMVGAYYVQGAAFATP